MVSSGRLGVIIAKSFLCVYIYWGLSKKQKKLEKIIAENWHQIKRWVGNKKLVQDLNNKKWKYKMNTNPTQTKQGWFYSSDDKPNQILTML